MKKERVNKDLDIKSILVQVLQFIVIAIILYFNTSIIAQTVKRPGKTPNFLGYRFFVIMTGSMDPEIKAGELIIVDVDKKVNSGDIIAFKSKENVIVHRVVEVIEAENGSVHYQTKGDSNNAADISLVVSDNIEGVYKKTVPYVGKVLMFLYQNFIVITILILIFVIIKIFFKV